MDVYVCCPYNAQHRVPKSRIQQHLIKCERSYPRLAICPYDATHRFPDNKMDAHVSDCPAKEQYLLEDKPNTTNAILTTIQPIPQKEYVHADDPDSEYWDN